MIRSSHLTQTLPILAAIFCTFRAELPMDCVIKRSNKTVAFGSLKEYRDYPRSFDTNRSTYAGHYVNFSSIKISSLPNAALQRSDSKHILKLSIQVQLVRIEDGAFEGLDCLQYLNLAGNRINSLSEKTFEGVLYLKRLDLSANMLRILDGNVFKNLEDLIQLDLAVNRITTISPSIFADLRDLRILDLGINKIEKIPRGLFANLERLKGLLLDNNLIKHVDDVDLAGPKNLTVLDLSVNDITHLGLSSDSPLKNLKRLNLSYNALPNLNQYDVADHLPELVYVDVYFNNIMCRDFGRFEKYLSGVNIKVYGTSCLGDIEKQSSDLIKNTYNLDEEILYYSRAKYYVVIAFFTIFLGCLTFQVMLQFGIYDWMVNKIRPLFDRVVQTEEESTIELEDL